LGDLAFGDVETGLELNVGLDPVHEGRIVEAPHATQACCATAVSIAPRDVPITPEGSPATAFSRDQLHGECSLY
jgi:hypothetical protein